jgi:S1-C subfamily serine protease
MKTACLFRCAIGVVASSMFLAATVFSGLGQAQTAPSGPGAVSPRAAELQEKPQPVAKQAVAGAQPSPAPGKSQPVDPKVVELMATGRGHLANYRKQGRSTAAEDDRTMAEKLKQDALAKASASVPPGEQPPPPAAQSLEHLGQIVRTLQQGVFIVGSPQKGCGTAFVISRKHRLLATNAHVADIQQGGTMKAVMNGTSTAYTVERVYYHPGVLRHLEFSGSTLVQSPTPGIGSVYPFSPDVAVLQLEKAGPELPVEFPMATREEVMQLLGHPVGMLGFPGHDSNWPRPGALTAATYHQGVVSRVTDFRRQASPMARSAQFVQHTAQGAPGFSGSPVFLANGHVVALHNSGHASTRQGKTVNVFNGVRIDCLWELLVSHNLHRLVPIGADVDQLDLDRYFKDDPALDRFGRVAKLLVDAGKLQDDGHYAKAVDVCSQAIDVLPDYALSYSTRAATRMLHWARWAESRVRYAGSLDSPWALRQLNAALDDYNTAIKLWSNCAHYYEGRANVYDALGQAEWANADRLKAARLKPPSR